jgi:hypothetical protein
VKELDFLPDWYKADRRRQVHVRRQYVALVIVFLVMMTFNVTALHRAGKASAEGTRLENQRVGAEAVVREFDDLTRKLNELKGKANLVEQIDARVDMAAVLAELSRLIGDSIVLRRLEIEAEPFGLAQDKGQTSGSVVRLAAKGAGAEAKTSLGRVKFRIVLTGVAARPADAPDLVCRLDGSSYFQRVQLLFCGSARAQGGARAAPVSPDGGTAVPSAGGSNLTEFEIACYLANYKEIED